MHNLNIRLPDNLFGHIRNHAAEHGVSVAELMRHMSEAYLAAKGVDVTQPAPAEPAPKPLTSPWEDAT